MSDFYLSCGQAVLPYPVRQTKKFIGPAKLPIWQRLLIAIAFLIVLGAIGGAVWVFGILMFTFSLDGASSSQLPKWLDSFMLVGWPASIVLVPVVPAILVVCRASWTWILRAIMATTCLSAGIFMTGTVSLFSAI